MALFAIEFTNFESGRSWSAATTFKLLDYLLYRPEIINKAHSETLKVNCTFQEPFRDQLHEMHSIAWQLTLRVFITADPHFLFTHVAVPAIQSLSKVRGMSVSTMCEAGSLFWSSLLLIIESVVSDVPVWSWMVGSPSSSLMCIQFRVRYWYIT